MVRTITWTSVASPVGILYLAATENGLAFLDFGKSVDGFHRRVLEAYPKATLKESTRNLDLALQDLNRYWRGENAPPRSVFDLKGTQFQVKVWTALKHIPFGKVISYGDLAAKIGKPKSFRAVGAAVGKNPVAILIPCHRVIGSDGTLCGYGGGLDNKAKLLSHEGVQWKLG